MGYNTMNAPLLLNYGQAKDWHDKSVPIRGNPDKVRPLGSRRHWQMGSISMKGDDVVLNYYNEPVVTWHPDDSLTVQLPRYVSAYEPDKLCRYLPPYLDFKWNERRLVVYNQLTQQGLVLEEGRPIKLKAVGVTDWHRTVVRKYEFDSLPEVFKYEKKHGKAGKIMKAKFQPFFDWLESVKDIMPPMQAEECDKHTHDLFHTVTGVTPEQLKKTQTWYETTPWTDDNRALKTAWSEDHTTRECYPMGGRNSWRPKRNHAAGIRALYNMLLPENQDQWYTALCIIARANSYRYWGGGAPFFKAKNTNYIHDYVERIVCFVHRDEVFNRVTLPAGAIPKRTHHEFFVEQKLKFFIENSDNVSVISN